MTKKIVCMLFCFVLLSAILSSFALAQEANIEISIEDTFQPGDKITFKVSLFDSTNTPINDNVMIVITDPEKTKYFEQSISSDSWKDIDLGKNVSAGYWTITAKYNGKEVSQLFMIEANEEGGFVLNGDVLTVTNVGNTRYTQKIHIQIGDSNEISKEVDLFVGESLSFRLLAPDGTYDIRITDEGGKTTPLTKSGVRLTGQAVGVLDERMGGGNPLTGGVKPEENQEDAVANSRNRNLVYVFVFVVFGAVILLSIERNLRKKV